MLTAGWRVDSNQAEKSTRSGETEPNTLSGAVQSQQLQQAARRQRLLQAVQQQQQEQSNTKVMQLPIMVSGERGGGHKFKTQETLTQANQWKQRGCSTSRVETTTRVHDGRAGRR